MAVTIHGQLAVWPSVTAAPCRLPSAAALRRSSFQQHPVEKSNNNWKIGTLVLFAGSVATLIATSLRQRRAACLSDLATPSAPAASAPAASAPAPSATSAAKATSATKEAPSATKATSAASATSAPAPSATSATTASATPRKFFADFRCSGVFLVEDIERRQIHVRDFLLMECNFVTRCSVIRRYICPRPTGLCGCAARQRQGHPGDPQ